jgi:hypothetical protein
MGSSEALRQAGRARGLYPSPGPAMICPMDTQSETVEATLPEGGGDGWISSLFEAARAVGAGVLGGFVTGLSIGGVGGRIAMFLLRLTSSASVIGLKTDDDFTIGRLSGETGFLLAFTAGLGVLGALFYLLVRSWFRLERRPLLTGIFGGVLGGALFVNPGGVDFTLISPLPLAIAFFIALPAAYGVALSVLVERWLREDSMLRRSWVGWLGLVPLAFILFTGPIGLLLILMLPGAWWLGRTVPSSIAAWHSPPVTWIGRGLLAGLTGLALIDLIRKTVDIL